MKCLDCQHIKLQTSPRHTASGFAPCAKQILSGVFQSIERDRACSKFERAPADVIQKRDAWNKKRGS
jgi:hypothetical protein